MKEKVKVAFLGSRPLGALALQLLRNLENVEVVACVARKPAHNAWWDEDPYFSGLPVLNSHEGLEGVDFDLGVSINYWRIMPPELINPPKLGVINLHHAFNLALRGRDMTAHAILSCRESNRWFHGSCLHYTDDGLDTGPIIASKACEILEQDTGWSLFHKAEVLGAELLTEWLPRLCKSKVPAAYPEPDQPFHKREVDNENSKFIADLYADPLRSYDTVRAYEFGGHFLPAYTFRDGAKVYLTINKTLGNEVLLNLDSERVIYRLKGCVDDGK